MRVSGLDGFRLMWVVGALLLLPGAVEAQLRPVVSNEIAVSGQEASLRLDFPEADPLVIAFQDGQVRVNDEVVGSYTRGDALDAAWRSLLGDVIALDDGPLARALYDWTPPETLEGMPGEVATLLDQAVEGALALPEASRDVPEAREGSEERSTVEALLRRSGALRGLSEALELAPLDDFILKVGQDVTVDAGDEVDRTLIVVDGDLDVRGLVRGDVILTHGTVRVRDGGRIAGDVRLADGEVDWEGGSIDGEVLDLEEAGEEASVRALGPEEVEDLRRELEREIRRDVLSAVERERSTSSAPSFIWRPLRNIGMALGGLLENLATFIVLGILGVLVVHFAPDRLEVVATTAGRAPGRSAAVGLAGGFLLFPVWILGMVALAITIVGIPVLLAWIPLFPIAAAVAALLGYLAVARNVGEWVADQEYRGLEWIRGSNTAYAVLAGLAAFLVPCVASNLVRVLGLDFLQGLLAFLGSAISVVAATVGLGAVLLTRGGKIRPSVAYYEFEEEEELWAEDAYRTSEPPREGYEGPDEPGEPSTGPAGGPEESDEQDQRPESDEEHHTP